MLYTLHMCPAISERTRSDVRQRSTQHPVSSVTITTVPCRCLSIFIALCFIPFVDIVEKVAAAVDQKL